MDYLSIAEVKKGCIREGINAHCRFDNSQQSMDIVLAHLDSQDLKVYCYLFVLSRCENPTIPANINSMEY